MDKEQCDFSIVYSLQCHELHLLSKSTQINNFLLILRNRILLLIYDLSYEIV